MSYRRSTVLQMTSVIWPYSPKGVAACSERTRCANASQSSRPIDSTTIAFRTPHKPPTRCIGANSAWISNPVGVMLSGIYRL